MTAQIRQQLERGFGILMPISALPSPYGIGTFGKASYQFIDFLNRIGCRYWQVLPIGPTSYGDSPYQSFSAFAGNPYFIDLDILIKEELLAKEDINQYQWEDQNSSINYSRIYQNRFQVLKKAYQKSGHRQTDAYQKYCKSNCYWLEDYCLYMALKSYFNNKEWLLWDEEIRTRNKKAIEEYTFLLQEEIDFWKFCQFKFKEQWKQIKSYANRKGIKVIGDIPLYVAMDSADVWVHDNLFDLDERKMPIHVAGVPPDLFSKTGQRWGNPIYRWDEMEREDFTWWRERMKISSALYDVIRIDHFIGIVNYYSIPSECPTAKIGRWMNGPGQKMIKVFEESIGKTGIIAEDLGVVTNKVKDLMKEAGYPGMKVLEFGLDGPPGNDYLPHNYQSANTVAYTGTHDNETLVGYLNRKKEAELKFIYQYFQVKKQKNLPDAIIRALISSVADIAIIQMQDLLKLDNRSRTNLPSTIGMNWRWRMEKSQYKRVDEKMIYDMAVLYGRTKERD